MTVVNTNDSTVYKAGIYVLKETWLQIQPGDAHREQTFPRGGKAERVIV